MVLVEKAVIELKSPSHGAIALSDMQEELIQELIAGGFKIYIVSAQFKPNWIVEFTVYRMS
jgi:phosphoserine phosphatase